MNNRKLIIDCQVLQTNAWDRGMGKYSLSLLRALYKNGNELAGSTPTLVLNSNLSTDKEMLKALDEIFPNSEKSYLDLLVPSARRNNKDTSNINKRIIENFIDNTYTNTGVDFLILSLFLDQAFIVFPENARKLLLFYDLIPFLYEKRYSERINYEDYLTRFSSIFEADIIFTISQTVADDLSVYLGIPENRLFNINGAAINRNHLKMNKPEINITKKYILMNSGDDLRKNNVNAVKGFAEFNEMHGNSYSLVVTSSFTENSIKEIKIYSDDVIFTGNVTEPELKWLYSNSEFIFCPSEYEGLGLPVLESVILNMKIACSNIPVFREISNDAFYLFDATDYISIANGLNNALQGVDWELKRSFYPNIIKKYGWNNTAKTLIKAYDIRFDHYHENINNKPRIAVFTPDPSGYSAIGKIVAETHANLSELFEIEYYFDYQSATHNHVRPDYLSHIANCFDAKDFNVKKYKEYSAVIYNIGNSDYHLNTIVNALYLPGITILHDTNLEGAFNELLRLGYISQQRHKLEQTLNTRFDKKDGKFMTSLLNNQIGIIVHSEYAKNAILHITSSLNIITKKANLPVSTPVIFKAKPKDDKLTIGLAGILADIKGLPVIESIASNPLFQNIKFTIFGFSFIKPEILNRLENLPNVEILLDLSDFEFQTRLENLDILINYRLSYQGETSLTVLESMRYGVVSIVRNIGWYSEIPQNSVIQINDPEELEQVIDRLKSEVEEKFRIGQAAKHYTKTAHGHKQYVENIQDLINIKNTRLNLKIKLIKESNGLRQFKKIYFRNSS